MAYNLNDSTAYVYNKPKWQDLFAMSHHLPDSASVDEYENAYILPLKLIPNSIEQYGDGLFQGGVASEKQEFIAGLQRSYAARKTNRSCIEAYTVNTDQVPYRNETVIFGGILSSEFGHALVDSTTRLWYPSVHQELDCKVVFVTYPGQDFPFTEFLELAGIPMERVEVVTTPTQFARVIVPEQAGYSLAECKYHDEWVEYFNVVRNHIEPAPYEKIYLTRTQFEKQNCLGEIFFEDFFRANGYEVFAPEKLPLKDQIALFAGAKQIVATMGTVTHMALFAQKGAELTILNRSEDAVRVQNMVGQISGIKTVYIDCFKNFLPESQGGDSIFMLYPTKYWEEYLDEHANRLNLDRELQRPLPLEKLSMDYLRAWGKHYQNYDAYVWIKNATVTNLVERVNRHLLDNEVDTSTYAIPSRYQRQQKQLKRSACEVEILKRHYCYLEEAVVNDNELLIRGVTAEKPLSVELLCDGGTPCQLPVESATTKDELCSWSSRCALGKLFEAGRERVFTRIGVKTADGSTTLSCISAVNLLQGQPITPLAKLTGDSSIYRLQGLDCANAKVSVNGALLPLANTDTAVCRMRSIEWKEQSVSAIGAINIKGSSTRDLPYDIALRNAEDPNDLIALPSSALSELGPGKPVSLSFEIGFDALRDYLDAMKSDKATLELGALIHLGSNCFFLPIGRNRPEGFIKKWARGCIDTQAGDIALPGESADKGFEMRLYTAQSALKDTVRDRITALRWEHENLIIDGTLQESLCIDEGFSFRFGLAAQDGSSVWLGDTIINRDSDDKRNLTWSATCDLSKFAAFAKKNERSLGIWTFCLQLERAGQNEVLPIGYRRPKGTLGIFQEVEALEFEPLTIAPISYEKLLGFKVGAKGEGEQVKQASPQETEKPSKQGSFFSCIMKRGKR